jgi:riboflavin kinase
LTNKKLEGIVFTGEGNGKKYLALPWVKKQLEEKLGYSPFLGTLNLKLIGESVKHKKILLKVESSVICPAEGYCVGRLFKASIDGTTCAVIVPQVKGYPENVMEVIAQVNLRETLKLKEGDTVTVLVQV